MMTLVEKVESLLKITFEITIKMSLNTKPYRFQHAYSPENYRQISNWNLLSQQIQKKKLYRNNHSLALLKNWL